MLGPLFRYELARLARRGLQPKLRAAFAALMLVVLFMAYLTAFPQSRAFQILTQIDEPLSVEVASRFGEWFLVAFLLTQAGVVVLVTPAIAAGAIGEEKDRGSLDLLLTTSMTSTEIVVGKLAARLVFVGMLLLTGLPVVTLVTLFGGVDVERLLAGYAIALITMVSYGTFAVYLAVVRDGLMSAILRAYGWVAGAAVVGFVGSCFFIPALLAPFSALMLVFGERSLFLPNAPTGPWEVVGLYALLHFIVAGVAFIGAIAGLRSCEAESSPPLPRPHYSRDDLPLFMLVEMASLPRTRWIPPVPSDDPLGWKERYYGGLRPWFAGWAGIVFPLLVTALVGVMACCLGRWLVVAAMAGAVVVTGVVASTLIARERQSGTLDSLLVIPRPRAELVWAKAKGALYRSRRVVLGAFGIGYLAVSVKSIAGPSLFALPLLLLGWMLAAIGSGLWLSARSQTATRAVGYWLAGFVVLGVLAPLAAPLARGLFSNPFSHEATFAATTCEGLSLVKGLWNATPLHREWGDYRWSDFTGAVAGAALAGLMGLLLAWRAVKRLERNR